MGAVAPVLFRYPALICRVRDVACYIRRTFATINRCLASKKKAAPKGGLVASNADGPSLEGEALNEADRGGDHVRASQAMFST